MRIFFLHKLAYHVCVHFYMVIAPKGYNFYLGEQILLNFLPLTANL